MAKISSSLEILKNQYIGQIFQKIIITSDFFFFKKYTFKCLDSLSISYILHCKIKLLYLNISIIGITIYVSKVIFRVKIARKIRTRLDEKKEFLLKKNVKSNGPWTSLTKKPDI